MKFLMLCYFESFAKNPNMKKKSNQLHYSSITIMLPLGILMGVISFSFLHLNYIFHLVAIVLTLFFCAFNAFIFRKYGRLLFAFIAGFLISAIRYQSVILSEQFLEGSYKKNIEVELRVASDISHKNKSWRFGASSIIIDNTPLDCTFYVSLPDSYPKPQRGDKLLLQGQLLDGFGEYAGYLARPSLIELSKPDPPEISLKLRDYFSSRFEELIGPGFNNEVALGLGYLTGQKETMSEDFTEKLRRAGLAHIVVASGFHLGVVTSLAKRLFKKVSRFASYSSAFLAIIIFVSITGFSASMIRAGLVIGMSLFASYFGRKFHPARLLLYAASISLLYKPQLILNTAWQLSFASFAGLLFFAPLITDYFFGEDIGAIPQSLIQTISAQLFCLPISIYTFGAFSPIGLISNLIIPPTIPLAMLLCVSSVVISFVPELGILLAYPTRLLLSFHVGVINYLSHFDWANISLKSGDIRVFWIYLILICVCLFFKWRSKHSFRPKYAKLSAMEKSQKDVKIYSC